MFHHQVPAPVTPAQARHAIRGDWRFYGQRVLYCQQAGAGQSCEVGSEACFTDAVFGPSLIVAGESVLVARDGRRYTVRQATPDTFQVYTGGCGDD